MWIYLFYLFICVIEYVYIVCVFVIYVIRNKNNFLKCFFCFGKGSNYYWISSYFWIYMGESIFNIVICIKSVEGGWGGGWVVFVWIIFFRYFNCRVDIICIIKLIFGLKYRLVEILVIKGYLYVLYIFIIWCLNV